MIRFNTLIKKAELKKTTTHVLTWSSFTDWVMAHITVTLWSPYSIHIGQPDRMRRKNDLSRSTWHISSRMCSMKSVFFYSIYKALSIPFGFSLNVRSFYRAFFGWAWYHLLENFSMLHKVTWLSASWSQLFLSHYYLAITPLISWESRIYWHQS